MYASTVVVHRDEIDSVAPGPKGISRFMIYFAG